MRKIVIGLLEAVTVLYFFAITIGFALLGNAYGSRFGTDCYRSSNPLCNPSNEAGLGAAIGGGIGLVVAVLTCGVIFVLLDIRDAVRENRAQP